MTEPVDSYVCPGCGESLELECGACHAAHAGFLERALQAERERDIWKQSCMGKERECEALRKDLDEQIRRMRDAIDVLCGSDAERAHSSSEATPASDVPPVKTQPEQGNESPEDAGGNGPAARVLHPDHLGSELTTWKWLNQYVPPNGNGRRAVFHYESLYQAVNLLREQVQIAWKLLALAPKFRCKICGCLWRLCQPTEVQPKGSWSLWDGAQKPGACCDNAATGDQLEGYS